jgi:hypothetical protein
MCEPRSRQNVADFGGDRLGHCDAVMLTGAQERFPRYASLPKRGTDDSAGVNDDQLRSAVRSAFQVANSAPMSASVRPA